MSAYEMFSNTNHLMVRFEGLKYYYALFRNDVEPAVLHGLGYAGFAYFHLFGNWLVRFQRVLTSILTSFVARWRHALMQDRQRGAERTFLHASVWWWMDEGRGLLIHARCRTDMLLFDDGEGCGLLIHNMGRSIYILPLRQWLCIKCIVVSEDGAYGSL